MKNNPLFDKGRVSLALDFNLDERHHTDEMTHAMQLISVSGVQEKFPAVVDGGKIRLAREGERIHVTRRSVNHINELQNHTWERDKDGNFVNAPFDAFNHAIDAVGYYVLVKLLGRILKTVRITADDILY